MGGYDVARYDWDLRVDVETGSVNSTAAMTATGRMDVMALDFTEPTPESVTLDGARLPFQ